jgi:hypothetical protein
MALTFPISPAGLEVDVLVNLEAAALVPLWQSGAQAPPIQGRGLIDTGSDITAVSLTILQQLGVQPLVQTTTQSIAGGVPVNLYKVSLHVFDARNPGLPWIPQPTLLVMELAPGLPLDVLIGMDIIRVCKMHVDGPAGRFTLEQ